MIKQHNLPRLLGKVFSEPWAIMPSKLSEISGLLEKHVLGKLDITAMGFDLDAEEDQDDIGYRVEGTVAVVKCHGVIGKRLGWLEMLCGGCDVDQLVKNMQAASADDRVKAIIMDVDSPGGTITGTPEAAEAIEEIAGEIPVVAFTETQMCSAAYWLSCGAGEIISTPSATVGSIGVIIAGVDDSERWAALGLKPQIFKSGELKDAGRGGVKWTKEHRAFLQRSVDTAFEDFKTQVITHRPQVPDEAMTGGWYSGKDVESYGLADGFTRDLGTLIEQMKMEFDMPRSL